MGEQIGNEEREWKKNQNRKQGKGYGLSNEHDVAAKCAAVEYFGA